MPTEAMNPTYLYRHFDANNRLLYVGVTSDPELREQCHKRGAWGGQISKTVVEECQDRESALKAERDVIAVENPVFNVNKRPPGSPQAPLNTFRKRSFDPEQDVAMMLEKFEADNPASKTAWHINAALREYLGSKGYK